MLSAASLFGSVWWGWQWVTSTEALRQGFSQAGAFILFSLSLASTRALLLELATPTLTFERTTIEIRKRLFGLTVSRHWYVCYRVLQFRVTHFAQHPDELQLAAITDKNHVVVLAARLPTDVFTELVHRIRRKEFAYFREKVAE